MSLNALLENKIKQSPENAIPFSEFMNDVLYHPKEGYYCRPNISIGKEGDFITAPELSPLFAACVAHSLKPIFLKNEVPKSILEIGAGRGTFAFQLLKSLSEQGIILDEYILCDRSESLIQYQKKLLSTLNLPTHIRWVSNLPKSFSGVIFANELFDAIPCERFKIEKNEKGEIQYLKQMISYSNHQFFSVFKNTFDEKTRSIIQALDAKYVFPLDYQSEILTQANDYLEKIIQLLKKGLFIFFDYGQDEKQYYHANRSSGTLRCFYQHQVHGDFLLNLGEQDLTVDVNFTNLAYLGIQHGLSLLGYTTQAGFLLENQLLDFAKARMQEQSEIENFQMQQAIKLLTLPTEMGEKIKCMAFARDIETKICGFEWQDRRMTL